MIVSHSRRFIFIKSAKTAGTSLEAALSSFCSGKDVVTPLGDYEFNRDETGRWVHRPMNANGFEQHDWGVTIRDKVGSAVWNEYFKFSIARNPWDRVVSLFTWKARNDREFKAGPAVGNELVDRELRLRQLRTRFSEFVKGTWQTNDRFYLIDGRCCVDFIIRYENLADDVQGVCRRLGIPAIELPRLKSGFKPGQFHYSRYYDADSEALVADRHSSDIRLFGYRFERV